VANLYTQYEAELTQLEAEEGLSPLFDFLRAYSSRSPELCGTNFLASNERFHEVREMLGVIFQERLGLNAQDSEGLFCGYVEHYRNGVETQRASEAYFEIEEKITACVNADVVAANALRGIRDFYAKSVNAPFEGEIDIDTTTAWVQQMNNYKNMLVGRLAAFHEIDESQAYTMVNKFTQLQHLNAKQLVHTRLNEGNEGFSR
jgi:hypothetical protein